MVRVVCSSCCVVVCAAERRAHTVALLKTAPAVVFAHSFRTPLFPHCLFHRILESSVRPLSPVDGAEDTEIL